MRTAPSLRQPSRLGQVGVALGDALLRATTRRLDAGCIEAFGLFEVVDIVEAKGWSVRSAGPRWFIAWHRDIDRLRRLRVIVLPELWVGLTGPETAALLAAQIEALGLGRPERRALGASTGRIWTRLAQGIRSG